MTEEWINDRPPGWVTLKPKYYPLHCLAADACVATSYEQGASDVLSALRERGIRVVSPESPEWAEMGNRLWSLAAKGPGHLIWLPEAKETIRA